MDMKLQFLVDSNVDWIILVPILDILISIFTLGSPVKSFAFPCEPGNRVHDARIIFNNTSVELCQSLKVWMTFTFFGGGILTKDSIFFGSGNLPAWQTM